MKQFSILCALAVWLAAPPWIAAQADLWEAAGTWQTVLPSGEPVRVDLAVNRNAENRLDGFVRFESGRIESISEGTIERVDDGLRIHFETFGQLNGETVLLHWDGEQYDSSEMTVWTTIQELNGREIELYSPRVYVRVGSDLE